MQATRGWEGTAGGWQLELLKCQHSGCPEQSQAQRGAPFHFSHLPGPAARGHSPAACRLEPGLHRGRGVFSTWFKATVSATETACGLGTRATMVADTLAHDTSLAGGSQPLGQGQSLRPRPNHMAPPASPLPPAPSLRPGGPSPGTQGMRLRPWHLLVTVPPTGLTCWLCPHSRRKADRP